MKHELSEIVYKVGQVVDPLTGKRVAGTEFLELLTDLAPSPDKDVQLSEMLEELHISGGSRGGDIAPAQNPSS